MEVLWDRDRVPPGKDMGLVDGSIMEWRGGTPCKGYGTSGWKYYGLEIGTSPPTHTHLWADKRVSKHYLPFSFGMRALKP